MCFHSYPEFKDWGSCYGHKCLEHFRVAKLEYDTWQRAIANTTYLASPPRPPPVQPCYDTTASTICDKGDAKAGKNKGGTKGKASNNSYDMPVQDGSTNSYAMPVHVGKGKGKDGNIGKGDNGKGKCHTGKDNMVGMNNNKGKGNDDNTLGFFWGNDNGYMAARPVVFDRADPFEVMVTQQEVYLRLTELMDVPERPAQPELLIRLERLEERSAKLFRKLKSPK
jgi:hypothetical protein